MDFALSAQAYCSTIERVDASPQPHSQAVIFLIPQNPIESRRCHRIACTRLLCANQPQWSTAKHRCAAIRPSHPIHDRERHNPMFNSWQVRPAAIAAFAVIATVSSVALEAQTSFPAEVLSTHPIAFYRLDATSGQSQIGATTYEAIGSAGIAETGAPVLTANGRYLKLDGETSYITTTQFGGVGAAASIMAWVNLAQLPSKAGHFFYVAGESENGNDLDVQIETDNVLKFYTSGPGFADRPVASNCCHNRHSHPHARALLGWQVRSHRQRRRRSRQEECLHHRRKCRLHRPVLSRRNRRCSPLESRPQTHRGLSHLCSHGRDRRCAWLRPTQSRRTDRLHVSVRY